MPTGIIPAVMGLIKMGVGAANKASAKSEAEMLGKSRPKIGLNTDELRLNESELQQGLGARAERAYTMQSDKGLSNSLSAILSGGGNLNNIGSLYSNADDGYQKLAMLEENSRLNKINNLISSQRNNVAQQDKQFEFNEWMPWADKAQANALALQSADAMIAGGQQTVGASAMQFGQNNQEQAMFNKYLNNQNKPTIQTGGGGFDGGQDFYQYADTQNYSNTG